MYFSKKGDPKISQYMFNRSVTTLTVIFLFYLAQCPPFERVPVPESNRVSSYINRTIQEIGEESGIFIPSRHHPFNPLLTLRFHVSPENFTSIMSSLVIHLMPDDRTPSTFHICLFDKEAVPYFYGTTPLSSFTGPRRAPNPR